MYFSLDGSSWKACLKSALWGSGGGGRRFVHYLGGFLDFH